MRTLVIFILFWIVLLMPELPVWSMDSSDYIQAPLLAIIICFIVLIYTVEECLALLLQIRDELKKK